MEIFVSVVRYRYRYRRCVSSVSALYCSVHCTTIMYSTVIQRVCRTYVVCKKHHRHTVVQGPTKWVCGSHYFNIDGYDIKIP